MRIGEATIAYLVCITYDTGMSSSPLISFFNSFGLKHEVVHMLPSKSNFANQAWSELNGKPEIADAINQILSPHFWPDAEERKKIIAGLNQCLEIDDLILVKVGNKLKLQKKVFYSGLDQLRTHGGKIDHENVLSRILLIEASLEESPGDAIGAAKELIEAVCKDTIESFGGEVSKKASPSGLVKSALKVLSISPDDISDAKRGSEAIKSTLTGLANIAHQLDEIRSLYGSGHGKSRFAKGLEPRHARLAVGAASTLCLFLVETVAKTLQNKITS